jgi:hypothetical protein
MAVSLGRINPGQPCLITGSSHLHCVVSSDASTSKGTWGAYKGAPLPGLNFAEGVPIVFADAWQR